MAAAILVAFAAIRRGDVARHRAWMMRGYAIGIAAGTQAVLALPLVPVAGMLTGLPRAVLLGAGWVVNLLVAEWIIRRRSI
jgi:hypothetical protein